MTIDNKIEDNSEHKMCVIVEDNESLGFVFPLYIKQLNKYNPIILCEKYEDITEHHLSNAGLYLLDHDIKGGISGTEFLKKHHYLPKDKIILMSGRDEAWEYYTDKSYNFLLKPFGINDLKNKIHEMKI